MRDFQELLILNVNQKPPIFINFLYFWGFVDNKIGGFGSVPLAQARLMLVASHFPLPSPPEAWAHMEGLLRQITAM
jgi:hypothetical protein